MDAQWLQSILVWVQAHPLAAGWGIFAASVGESLFLFGLLVPGAFLMFIAGALVGAGALELWPVLGVAMAGAIVGDSASFALGYAYRGNLHNLRLLRRAPKLLARGESFFQRHGGKGLILGRFVGPLRPVMPTVSGAAGMAPWRFACIATIAAIGWAPCYILPGVVFGASLDLAAQVAGRLALLLLLVLATVWVLIWALRWSLAGGAAWGRGRAERLLKWSRRHRRLGLLGPALADPRQPEIPVLALAAALLLFLTWLAYSLVWGFEPPHYPLRGDALIYHFSQNLHTPGSDFVAHVIALLGAPQIYLPLAAAIGAGLLLQSGRRAALHWLAAVSFALILVLGLTWLMVIPTPNAYFHTSEPAHGFAGGNILVSGVIYGFFAVILAAPRAPYRRQLYYSVFTGLIVLIALARLYLGLDWLSDLVIGLVVAFLWIALLALGYRRRSRPVKRRSLLAILLAAVTAAVVWQALQRTDLNTQNAANVQPQTMRITNWYDGDYRQLPSQIYDVVGRRRDPLNLQVRGNLEHLRAVLTQAGWGAPPAASFANSLLWLTAATPLSGLPVLPRIHDGRNPDLTLTRPVDANHQWILRLWRSHYTSANNTPLWLGQVEQQIVQQRLGLVRMPSEHSHYSLALAVLDASLVGAKTKTVRLAPTAGRANWLGEILLWDGANAPGDGRMSADPNPDPLRINP